MTKMTQGHDKADTAGFQELLNGETDDGRHSILSQLLSDEFNRFKPHAHASKSTGITSIRVIEDVGNPLKGIFLGAIMIVATMGGFFLWDIYQSASDAKTTALIDQE